MEVYFIKMQNGEYQSNLLRVNFLEKVITFNKNPTINISFS